MDTVGKCGARFSTSKKTARETLRVWVNTYLGETWEDEGERIDDFDIANHREPYGEKLPNDVVF